MNIFVLSADTNSHRVRGTGHAGTVNEQRAKPRAAGQGAYSFCCKLHVHAAPPVRYDHLLCFLDVLLNGEICSSEADIHMITIEIRQDAYANAQRIVQPTADAGLAWARHPEMIKDG